MNVRIGNYEIQPLDKMNWTVYRVAEDGEDVNGRKKALDGTPLLFLGKYSPTLAGALEIVRKLLLKTTDAAVIADVDGAIARIEELDAEFEETARRIEEAMADGR